MSSSSTNLDEEFQELTYFGKTLGGTHVLVYGNSLFYKKQGQNIVKYCDNVAKAVVSDNNIILLYNQNNWTKSLDLVVLKENFADVKKVFVKDKAFDIDDVNNYLKFSKRTVKDFYISEGELFVLFDNETTYVSSSSLSFSSFSSACYSQSSFSDNSSHSIDFPSSSSGSSSSSSGSSSSKSTSSSSVSSPSSLSSKSLSSLSSSSSNSSSSSSISEVSSSVSSVSSVSVESESSGSAVMLPFLACEDCPPSIFNNPIDIELAYYHYPAGEAEEVIFSWDVTDVPMGTWGPATGVRITNIALLNQPAYNGAVSETRIDYHENLPGIHVEAHGGYDYRDVDGTMTGQFFSNVYCETTPSEVELGNVIEIPIYPPGVTACPPATMQYIRIFVRVREGEPNYRELVVRVGYIASAGFPYQQCTDCPYTAPPFDNAYDYMNPNVIPDPSWVSWGGYSKWIIQSRIINNATNQRTYSGTFSIHSVCYLESDFPAPFTVTDSNGPFYMEATYSYDGNYLTVDYAITYTPNDIDPQNPYADISLTNTIPFSPCSAQLSIGVNIQHWDNPYEGEHDLTMDIYYYEQ